MESPVTSNSRPGAAREFHLRGQPQRAIGLHRLHAPKVHGVANAKANPDRGGRVSFLPRRTACPATRAVATASSRNTSLWRRRSGESGRKHLPGKRSRGSSGNRSSDAVVSALMAAEMASRNPQGRMLNSVSAFVIFHDRRVPDAVDQLSAHAHVERSDQTEPKTG